MSEYYAVQRSGESLAHYGVKGMRWGVRKNPQKAFYKSMKREMKNAGKVNRAAHFTEVSGAKKIGNQLPKDLISKIQKAQNSYDNAYNTQYNFTEKLYGNGATKKYTVAQQRQNVKKLTKLEENLDKASIAYESEMKNAKNALLGKYGRKKIKMDSPNTRMKWNADRVLESAIRSQIKEKPISVKLNEKQKRLEAQWKKSGNREDFNRFYSSMNEKTRKRYHDRYLL